MANRLAGGDLAARLPENGVGEIGALEQSLNVMAGSLETGREDLTRLAEEQAALRRVATLVAQRGPAAELFAAVAEESRALLGTDVATIARLEPDGTATMMGGSWPGFPRMAVGSRWTLEGFPAIRQVLQTGRSVRVDDYSGASGRVHDVLRRAGVRSSLGSPIAVEARLWGTMVVSSTHEALPPDIETRMRDFTELVATAIANAESREELTASRARIVQTADEERRRIERNLHDGAQQRLVSLGLMLHAAAAAIPADAHEARDELARVGSGIDGVIEDLREIARGIHPAILSEGGLGPALRTLARRSSVPVVLNVRVEARLPERVEVAGYYVVAEALTNAAKHARASVVHVDVDIQRATLRLVIRDDGLGGADPARGSGLVGLRDRVEAMGGTVAVESPVGRGTSLMVELPLGGTMMAARD